MEGIGKPQRQVSTCHINRNGGERWSVVGHMLVSNPIPALDVSKLAFILGNQGSLCSPLQRQKTWTFLCSLWLPDTVSSTPWCITQSQSLKWIPTLIALTHSCALLSQELLQRCYCFSNMYLIVKKSAEIFYANATIQLLLLTGSLWTVLTSSLLI